MVDYEWTAGRHFRLRGNASLVDDGTATVLLEVDGSDRDIEDPGYAGVGIGLELLRLAEENARLRADLSQAREQVFLGGARRASRLGVAPGEKVRAVGMALLREALEDMRPFYGRPSEPHCHWPGCRWTGARHSALCPLSDHEESTSPSTTSSSTDAGT
jgi:hypothetical protein